ncbi:LOW QUALITY PROTEIN: nuclear mitotic apparatus protein 1-like [Melopsittacus undulatus]|uniref:LOW QUALITY PROTEIN: nuclear mitotic apparatus protein 1-like n=1 Tax=Melopsittacus undulatus TaxID=13146 RepID=UPI00146EF8EE|nr:LOW QUALITY PROTEIN: nuclear mitotic apparatus protein 1-like [Melopsittacus undulatus]
MPLHGARAAALLAWVNSTNVCSEPIQELSQLRDCSVFIRIISRMLRSEAADSALEQPLPQRISFICSFLQKHCKHKSAPESLIPAQQLLEGEELALAKVAVMLLYHTSMSCRSPTHWSSFDYETQVELAAILRFVLDNEESLSENLEMFLHRKAPPPSSSSTSSEEHSPLLPFPQKREVRFLELQKIASSSSSSSSTNNALPAGPSSPMGDILQTPQFQLRRLRKQLAAERENRDELEVELAENRKLITEKEAQITLLQQRIDRLALLHEKHTAEQLEPKEMEELREKNESLLARLHEALRQCQDLKTEKGQMDRKISQLSEENGDLSFKLREIGSHLVQLQEALNELSEEHNAALAQAQEKQGQLETELRGALQDKKCSEEKIEILQGKLSLLQDQLAQLGESSSHKGEVLGDALKLEELKQEVSVLTSQGAELQATVLRLQEEKQQQEAALQSQRGLFEEEKQQLGSLVSSLQESLSESQRHREQLEQELRQLQHLQETNTSLSTQLQAMAQTQDSNRAAWDGERAELSRRIRELEGRMVELGPQQAQLQELEARLKESQQRLADRERLVRENGRLQEQLLCLEESLRNTEGILEDEKRRAAESLEGSLARIAELEAERQRLQPEPRMEEVTAAPEQRPGSEHQEAHGRLEAELSSARARAEEQEAEERRLKAEACAMRERVTAAEQALEQHRMEAQRAAEAAAQELARERLRCQEMEGAMERMRGAEAEGQRVRSRLEEELREHRRELSSRDEEAARLRQELERGRAESAAERGRRAEMEAQLQNSLNEQRVERGRHREELARVRELLQELHRDRASCAEELRELQGSVTRLRGELTAPGDTEPQGPAEAAQSKAIDGDSTKGSEGEPEPSMALSTEVHALRVQVEGLEQRYREHRESAAAVLEAAHKEGAQHRSKASELQKLLEAARAAQALQDGNTEALRQELLQSRGTIAAHEQELAALRAAAQDRGRAEEGLKEQLTQCVQELERKSSLVGSLEHEVSVLRRQAADKEAEGKELKRLVLAESDKSKKLEERLRVLQTEMATAASRAAERCSLMKVEVQRCQEEMDKQRVAMEVLRRERQSQGEREEELRQELRRGRDEHRQQEQVVAALRQELSTAQGLAAELPSLKLLCQQLQAERGALESQHRQELEQHSQAMGSMQAELAALRERAAEREHTVQRLQAELGQAQERHGRELERIRVTSEEMVAGSRREAQEAARKLEAVGKEQESSRAAALEERRELQEDRERLAAKVEQLEVVRKEQAKQVEELTKKLTQHEKSARSHQQRVKALEGELQAEATRQQQRLEELQEQLAQKEQAAEHYKGQMEKAKTHYDAKKQQNQELAEKLKAMEQLQKENTELRAESERLAKELQQSVLHAKETELSCRNLTSQVHSLEAQVEFANQQLRELGKIQVPKTTLKGQELFPQSPADISADSLDLSLEGAQSLHTSRKATRSRSEASLAAGTEESPAPRRLPRKVESLESLYFTPLPARTRAQRRSSTGSCGDLSLDSGCQTRSARRRTTISITMTKKEAHPEDLDSSELSFRSLPAAQARAAPARSRRRSGSSRSITTFPSQESLSPPDTSSPQDPHGHAALMALPGYRPVTRSSLRRMQGGSSSSLGRSSLYLGTCQDEPEQLDDWNRIAELQQRNRACPPHLKTCYPLESRPSNSLATITDEEMKTGDPRETLRRASMQPSQGPPPRRTTLGTAWAGITTRQQRKRAASEEPQGPDTPEPKKPPTCFPRAQTPQRRSAQHHSLQPAPGKPPERRQSLAFSILNTPKKLGNSLLRRANRKATAKGSPRAGSRRSPRIATAKTPKGKANRQQLKDTKF